MMGLGSVWRLIPSKTDWPGVREVASGGVHLIFSGPSRLESHCGWRCRGLSNRYQGCPVGALTWSAVRKRKGEEAVLEPPHAQLFKASILPAVHVLTDHRVEVGVGFQSRGTSPWLHDVVPKA